MKLVASQPPRVILPFPACPVRRIRLVMDLDWGTWQVQVVDAQDRIIEGFLISDEYDRPQTALCVAKGMRRHTGLPLDLSELEWYFGKLPRWAA